MPVRNGATFVEEALESIFHQTLAALEVIVVDDGSTDATPDLLRRAALNDGRVRVVTQPPRGLVVALNTAVELARAPFLARMDADDVAEPSRMIRQLSFLERHDRVAAVGGAIELIDGRGATLGVVRFPTQSTAIRRTLRTRNCVAHSAAMARTVAVRQAGAYREAFVGSEDYDLWLRLADGHDLANLSEVVTRYRLHVGHHSSAVLRSQAFAAIAARLCASRRESNEPEPPLPKTEFTREWVELAGTSGHALTVALVRHCLGHLETLGTSPLVSNEDLNRLLGSISSWIGDDGRPRLEAGTEWLLAKRSLRSGGLLSAGRGVARCIRIDPSFLPGRLLEHLA